MWLVPRDTPGLTGRTDVPAVVREALVRWYEGVGSEADHRASVTLVVKARDHRRWLACDCLGASTMPPLLSPAFLTEAETYYLRRLTSQGRNRPEHLTACPFHRPQAPQRFRERATAVPRGIAEPDGYFSALGLAAEKLAQAPDDADLDDRSRGVAIPRLARLLWRLMDDAGVNVLDALPETGGNDRSLSSELGRLRLAAERLAIAPGIPLRSHLYTHVEPLERGQVYARLRAAALGWPDGHAPQAFLALFAHDVSGATVTLAAGKRLEIANRVQHAGIHRRGIGGPLIVFVLVGELNPRDGYAALRAYAQPIASAGLLIPVQSAAEREVVARLARLQYRLRRRFVALSVRKPLFDTMTRLGPRRPDLALSLRDHRTGELYDAALVVADAGDPDEAALKAAQARDLAELGAAISVDADAVARGDVERAIAARLDLDLG